MKEFKFYINDIETALDIENYNDISFKVYRDKKYFGYYRNRSIDKIVFLKEDAKTIQGLFDSGLNGSIAFRIEQYNKALGCYEVYQDSLIDYQGYKEKYTKNGKLYKVECNLIDTDVQQKLRAREDLELKIGRDKSVDDDTITSLPLVDFLFKSRPLLKEAETTISGAFSGVPNAVPKNEMNFAVLGTLATTQNMEIYQNAAYQGDINPSNINNDPPAFGFNSLTQFSLILEQSRFNYSIDVDYEILVNIQDISFGSGTYNNLRFRIYEAQFDGVIFSNVNHIYTETFSVNVVFGFGNTTISDTLTFTKKANFVYFATLDANGQTWDLGVSGEADGTFNLSYLEDLGDSVHKGVFIYECFDSLLQQITGKTNIFKSDLLGRTTLGYPSNGEASEIIVTNGLLLRNATFSDDTNVDLTLTFEKLYSTLNALYGVGLGYDGEKFFIERREFFKQNSIEIDLTGVNFTRELVTDLIYNKVKVGNKQIKYENVNGTNEHNTILEFSNPIKISSNTLNLVTDYNTDYLGAELARRLSFTNDKNVDTKYDDKVFLLSVYDTFVWETKLGLVGYTSVSGVLLPQYAGNLDFSPKRMLLRNSDLIRIGMFNEPTMELRFEKSENLAALVSRATTEITDVVELSDVEQSEMLDRFLSPMKCSFEEYTPEELSNLKNLTNSSNLLNFKVKIGCKNLSLMLESAEFKNNLVKFTFFDI